MCVLLALNTYGYIWWRVIHIALCVEIRSLENFISKNNTRVGRMF